MSGRRLFAFAASIAVLAAASPGSAAPCMASAGDSGGADERGMGGTGLSGDRGTGGTGLSDPHGMGGTGIVGTVTGFGSICVNGLRIGYDHETPVDRAGRPIAASLLRIGQGVVVRAAGSRSDLRAAQISLLPAISGPVSSIDVSAGRIVVMHQPVAVSARTLGSLAQNLGRIETGDFVEVHGIRDHRGNIQATRIDRRAAGGSVLLAGLARKGRTGWMIGATEIATTIELTPTFVRVSGRWDQPSGRVVEVETEAVLPAEASFTRASVEAFVEARVGDRLSTSVLPIDASRIAAVGLATGTRIWAWGELTPAGTLIADAIDVDPIGGGDPYPGEEALDDSTDPRDEAPGNVDDGAVDDIDDMDVNDIDDGAVDDIDDMDVNDFDDGDVGNVDNG